METLRFLNSRRRSCQCLNEAHCLSTTSWRRRTIHQEALTSGTTGSTWYQQARSYHPKFNLKKSLSRQMTPWGIPSCLISTSKTKSRCSSVVQQEQVSHATSKITSWHYWHKVGTRVSNSVSQLRLLPSKLNRSSTRSWTERERVSSDLKLESVYSL